MNHLLLGLLAAEIYEPKNLIGLLGLLVSNAPALVTAGLSGLVLYRQRENSKTLRSKVDDVKTGVTEVKDQVKNGHPRPLRSDMDDIGAKLDQIDSKVDTLGQSHAELRGEVRGLTHRVDQITDR